MNWAAWWALVSLLMNCGLMFDRYFLEYDRMLEKMKRSIQKGGRCPLCGSLAVLEEEKK